MSDNRSNPTNKMKLHEAIEFVLQNMPNRTGNIEEITSKIIHLDLYKQKDGSWPFPKQIWLRAKNYNQFEMLDNVTIRLI